MTPEMTSPSNVERRDLSPDLSISRVLTGLWQLADMERDGRQIDLDRAAEAMRPYVEAGLTTFDMADHYGPAEIVAGLFRSRSPQHRLQLFTKWVPKPGRISKGEVRAAVERARTRLGVDAIDLRSTTPGITPIRPGSNALRQDLKAEGLVRHLSLTNVDTAHPRRGREQHRGGIEPGVVLAARSACRRRIVPYWSSGVQLLAYARWPAAGSPTAG
jgi:aryl-alcohol dehydrogenase-like predicted oxidoreductase